MIELKIKIPTWSDFTKWFWDKFCFPRRKIVAEERLFDQKFGENICTTLNEYFASYIGEIIDGIVLFNPSILTTSTDEKLKNVIIDKAASHIERK